MNIARRKPLTARVGIFGVGLDTYWHQFPGLLDELLAKKEILKNKLSAHSVELFDFGMTPELTSTQSYPERSAALAVEKLLAQLYDPEHRKSVTVLRIDELVIGGTTRIRRPRAEEEIPARRDFLTTTATIHNGKG